MDWETEPSLSSSEEEGRDEPDPDSCWWVSLGQTQQISLWAAVWVCVCVCVADTAYNCDPRIKKFKEEEKARKESEKKAKAEAKKREQEEKERVSPTEHIYTLT